MGVQASNISSLASHAAKDVCTFTNPRPCSADDYEALYRVEIAK
jgi:alcohol dehydrogenase class IV